MMEITQTITNESIAMVILSGGSLLRVIARLIEMFGPINLLIIIGLLIVFFIWYFNKETSTRRQRLLEKYGNTDIVDRIMSRSIWIGQTSEQLRDALGSPVDVDESVSKTKISEIWKYDRRGKNRHALRIALDDGIVIGWTTSHE